MSERLDSWKEIATYLGREVRTVQGWEKSEGLPVHRHQHARQGSVFAFTAELDAWRDMRRAASVSASTSSAAPTGTLPGPSPQIGKPATSRVGVFGAVAVVAAIAVVAVGAAWMRGTRSAPVTQASLSSIVVLPFLDLSPDKDQEYFTDGLTEEIIDSLSRVPNLRVIARTSAFAFKGTATDIREIGRRLDVDTVLEGSVRKSADVLRVTAQLNRVSDGSHLWSQTYDRPLRDVFAVQRELSQAIADRLQAGGVPARPSTTDLEAYRLFQEGRYLFNQHEPPTSYLKAIDKYQQAIDRDPTFALAHAGLADAYAYLAEQFVAAPTDVMPKARAAATRALALDDASAEAHTSLGIVKLDFDRDRAGAQAEFTRAMQIKPSSGYIRHWFAHSLEADGRIDEAMREMRAALALDPLLVPVSWDIANEWLWLERYDDALDQIRTMEGLFPDLPEIAYVKTMAYVGKGDMPAARRVLDALTRNHPDLNDVPMFMGLFAAVDAMEGRQADARRMLDRLEQLHQTQYVEPLAALKVCAVLKDQARLLLWLQRADHERSTQFIYLPFHDRDMYADTPAAKALVAAIH